MNRRDFLINAAFASGAALAFSGFSRRADVLAQTQNFEALRAAGYGDLAPVAAKNTGERLLALPKGFEYNVIGKVGNMMTDGRQTPRSHDAMATFPVQGELRIVRNHEIYNRTPSETAAIGIKNHYDPTAGGGTTTLIINRKSREIRRDFISLSGTLNNCAGGATTWGSWISCEETTFGQTKYTAKDGKAVGGYAEPHGYCFEVAAAANDNKLPVPLKAMGRFVHEAIAVDRQTGIVYETEDNNPAGFYRFIPNRKKHLASGGTLQALAIVNQPGYDTRTKQKIGAVLETHWLTIANPDPIEADTDSLAMFRPAMKNGAAIFNRLEGCIPGKNREIYFASTSGGDSRCGQIWMYQPARRDAGRLTLVFESPDRQILDMPDNICLYPKSDWLFMCEDSDYKSAGASPENYVRILTPNGKVADFAKNIAPGREASEFAGAAFSKNGKTLFVNLQTAGVTLAIWGDWKNFRG